ncbi:RagB/SusD family nutrient uptake outer membrane protein [Spirosoma validum]|uniref:RagB/SusD family nutrient uptake outer membrane protein n=1 Tax=Spirosoma validum TaxID=2771355 RepID=A0A927AZG0_9BACT|nr:RagB/SusD family nutrient uptake outer membrane protein [Spirosoma validum]MBD2752487.1 RagB/SusD family nutrient uptake outer membrane protein [Spirosoma validum]
MKNTRIKPITLIAGILVFLQFSCNKLVDLKPINEISDASYWNTPDQFKLAANEFYTYLTSFAQVLYDPTPTASVAGSPHSDIRADFVGQRTPYSNGSYSLLATDVNWNNSYSRLRAINYLLEKAATYPGQADITQYVAEAKFFRAYVYFDLLQQFGGVPIVTKSLSVDSPELQTPRNSRDEVVDLIVKDLEEAIAALPLESAITAANKGRVSKGAAQSFLARVGLYEGTWQKYRNNSARANPLLDKAIANSNTVITSAQYELFAPVALGDSALKYLFILENEKSNPASIGKSANREYILSNRYDYTLRQIRQNVTHTWFGSSLTRKFANQFLSQDGLPIEKSPLFRGYGTTRSEYQNRDNRMRYTMAIDSSYYWDNENPGARSTWLSDAADRASGRGRFNSTVNTVTGYANQKWGTERRLNDNEEGYDWPVIRLAEVYLIYAEATYERNGSISDADLDKSLNRVRNRVNKTMPKLSNAFATANGLDIRTEIRRERNVELFLEGFRIDDLKRWKTAEVEMPQPLLGIRWKGTPFERRWVVNGTSPYPLDAEGNLIFESGRQWSEKNYLLPIPTQQIQLNPQLTQNSGW